MGLIFDAFETNPEKHYFMMAHYEEYTNTTEGGLSYRFKTTGKMVQEFITPEGNFEIVLYGKTDVTEVDNKKTIKTLFVTNKDGQYPAKSPIGMFPDLYIPNDLGYVLEKINEYYK